MEKFLLYAGANTTIISVITEMASGRMKEGQQQPSADGGATVPPVEQKRA